MRRKAVRNWVGMLLGLCLVACGGPSELSVQEPYILLPPPGSPVAAGFMQIKNPTKEALELVRVEVEGFARVEMHETRMEDGMMRMRARDRVPLPPRSAVPFAPGGLHLMLFEPQGELAAGASLPGQLWLRSASGEERTIRLQWALQRRGAPAAAGEDHAHH